MSKKLKIDISSLEQAGKRFIDAWHTAEQSDTGLTSKELLTFESLEILLKVLTPKRLELLRFLHTQGAISIRSLSKHLDRDYSNVHADVRVLENCGLLNRTKDDAVYVPWSEIIAHLSLTPPSNKTFNKKPLRSKPVLGHAAKHHKKAS